MCANGFDAAQRQALDEWRTWAASEGEMARQLEEARTARRPDRRRTRLHGAVTLIDCIRRTIGALPAGVARR
jgi:hypothetical protein